MRMMRRGRAALGAVLMLGFPAAATATTTTQTFNTAGEHAFTVPPAVTSVSVTLVGGNGGTAVGGTIGGAGASETATLAVTPGEILYAEVGGNGGDGTQIGADLGGYNGGGDGGVQLAILAAGPSAGGGGGASDVRTVAACPPPNPGCPALGASLGSRLVVAAGGGGGGGDFSASDAAAGGPGGAGDAAGSAGHPDTHGDVAGGGGARGKTTGGGAAGTDPGGAGSGVTAGSLGAGGAGGQEGGGGGGGGGGGVYGGGGGGGGAGQAPDLKTFYGAGGGGGGGGASSLPPGPAGVSNLSLIPTDTGAQPQITFTWTIPAPTAITIAPTGVTSSSATLAGTVNPNATPLSDCHFAITPAPPGGPTISCAQQLGAAGTPVPVSAQLNGLSGGTTYTVRLIAGNAQGESTAAPVTFTTAPRGTGASAPQISGLHVPAKLHRHNRKHARLPIISLRLSQPATIRLMLDRLQGKRVIHTKLTLSVRGQAGVNRIPFGASGAAIGRYRLTLIAKNALGQSSLPHYAQLRVVR